MKVVQCALTRLRYCAVCFLLRTAKPKGGCGEIGCSMHFSKDHVERIHIILPFVSLPPPSLQSVDMLSRIIRMTRVFIPPRPPPSVLRRRWDRKNIFEPPLTESGRASDHRRSPLWGMVNGPTAKVFKT